jgi:N-dimethylarginine dimethylaminohydrolase
MDVLLMSPPRVDWRVHGRANVFSQSQDNTPAAAPVERGAALREWLALADAIVAAGACVAVLPWDDDDDTLTGMPYTAEAGALGRSVSGVVHPDSRVWLLPNLTPPHRRGEAARIEQLARAWGLRTHQVPVPWEGQGDIVDVGARGAPRYVCTSGDGKFARTSFEAYERVASFLDGPALHVRFHADPWFHGNTFLACFHGADASKPRERAIVACDDALFDGERARIEQHAGDGARWVSITRDESLQYATNALQVGARVLAPAGAPAKLHELWRALGLDVVEVALPTLFGRGGGAAVCLTNKLSVTPDEVPANARYENVRPALVKALA